MGVAAPVIEAEMDDWVALGGGNSGIVGDPVTHFYGFHLAANELPADDYSRWRDPNGADGPYVNWNYCCAGDFRHGGNEALRAKHRNVLARLMRGELPMICEWIGQPWADQPVYYWARWNGIGTLLRYTGAGHDLWSHISWYRSMANQRAYLWTPAPSTEEDEMYTIVQTSATDKTLWLSNGLVRRRISSQSEVSDLKWMASQGAIQLWRGGEIWVGVGPSWGVDVATLGVDVDEAALAASLAPLLPKPLTKAETVAAVVEGANIAEDR